MVKLINKEIVINVKIHKNKRKRFNKESQQSSKFVLTKIKSQI